MNQTQAATQPAVTHHYFRTFFAAVFGFLSLNLIILSLLTMWLSRTLTNTDAYVATVAPLIENTSAQEFLAEKATDALFDEQEKSLERNAQDGAGLDSIVSSDILQTAQSLLPGQDLTGMTNRQVLEQLKPVAKDSFKSILASPDVASVWRSTNKNAHASFVKALTEDGISIEIDIQPVINTVLAEAKKTQLAPLINELEVTDNVKPVQVDTERIEHFRQIYRLFNTGKYVLLAVAILFAGLSVWISVHHVKTLRRIVLFTGISTLILYLLLQSTMLIPVLAKDNDQAVLIREIVNLIFKELRLWLLILSIACIGGAIISKLIAVLTSKKSTK